MNAKNESFLNFLERRIPLQRDQIKECLALCRFLNQEGTLSWLKTGRFKSLLEEKAEDMIRAELLRGGELNLPSWDVDFYTF
jgi:hypothetical protein